MSNDEAPFRVGDRVTTDYERGEEDIVRIVTSVVKNQRTGSGWSVSADGGGIGHPIRGCFSRGIDSPWFKKVDE